MADDVVAHAFSHGFHPQHVERLAAYWAEALGGPATYSDSYDGDETVVKIHSGNGEHDEMNRRAIAGKRTIYKQRVGRPIKLRLTCLPTRLVCSYS
jgi:hypothetical protein